MRRAKLSAKELTHGGRGLRDFQLRPVAQGNTTMAIGMRTAGATNSASPGHAENALMVQLDAVAGKDHDGETGEEEKRRGVGDRQTESSRGPQ